MIGEQVLMQLILSARGLGVYGRAHVLQSPQEGLIFSVDTLALCDDEKQAWQTG